MPTCSPHCAQYQLTMTLLQDEYHLTSPSSSSPIQYNVLSTCCYSNYYSHRIVMSALKRTHNLVSGCHDNCREVIMILTLVKGYLRKGQALIGMKELTRAQQAYQKVLEIDPNNGVCF